LFFNNLHIEQKQKLVKEWPKHDSAQSGGGLWLYMKVTFGVGGDDNN
jgi:hypothetical protein